MSPLTRLHRHWGCGAYGNNNDLMFVKQWLAASEAGVTKMFYHDYSKDHSHLIFPLVRKLGHLTVGQLWAFLLDITRDLGTAAAFTGRMRELAVGKIAVPFAPPRKTKNAKKHKQKHKQKSKQKDRAAEAETISRAVGATKAETGAEGEPEGGTGATKAVPKSGPECVSSAGPKIAACGTTNAGKV